MSRHVALVRTDISEECSASIIRVTGISEPGTLAVVPPKCPFLQEPHSITSKKTAFFIGTTMKTSNLTQP
jgi:hypothetical protein